VRGTMFYGARGQFAASTDERRNVAQFATMCVPPKSGAPGKSRDRGLWF
jgi:hypothetical protein